MEMPSGVTVTQGLGVITSVLPVETLTTGIKSDQDVCESGNQEALFLRFSNTTIYRVLRFTIKCQSLKKGEIK